MSSENEINRELGEWNSSISGYGRKPPFERDEVYLNALPEQLAEYVLQSVASEKVLPAKHRISIPVWARGIAAALLLLIPASILFRWMNPDSIEHRVSGELRHIDAGSIETYLLQNSMEADESGIARYSANITHWQTEEALTALESTEIESYLNNYPSTEEFRN